LTPLDAVLATDEIAKQFDIAQIVGSVQELASTRWWQTRGSVRLARNTTEYLAELRLFLTRANWLAFIDPNLDPSERNYSEFKRLLAAAKRTGSQPAIQIHRKFRPPTPGSTVSWTAECEQIFRSSLSSQLKALGLRAEVFLWDEFHDRYLLSDLAGISIPYGFDVSTRPGTVTTWSRLARRASDDVAAEFDPNNHRHKLQHRFVLP